MLWCRGGYCCGREGGVRVADSGSMTKYMCYMEESSIIGACLVFMTIHFHPLRITRTGPVPRCSRFALYH